MLVGKITPRSEFRGYVKNKQQTEKKKLQDVLVKGDIYYNSGDLLQIDHQGFVYFQDRIGDTYRSVQIRKAYRQTKILRRHSMSVNGCG